MAGRRRVFQERERTIVAEGGGEMLHRKSEYCPLDLATWRSPVVKAVLIMRKLWNENVKCEKKVKRRKW